MNTATKIALVISALCLLCTSITHAQTLHDIGHNQTVEVPDNITVIPGEQVVVPDKMLEEMRESKLSLETNGFVQAPEHLPSSSATQFIAEAIRQRSLPREGARSIISISKEQDEKSTLGSIGSEFFKEDTEIFSSRDSRVSTRAYTNTTLGNIFVHEMPGANLGSIDANEQYNFVAQGVEAHRSQVHYKNGDKVSLFLFRTTWGVSLIEIGTPYVENINGNDIRTLLTGYVSSGSQ